MGVLDRLIQELIPLQMRAAETTYCWVATSVKLTENLKITSGGVIKPPTMANACCNPIMAARRSGRGSSKGWVGQQTKDTRVRAQRRADSPLTQMDQKRNEILRSTESLTFGVERQLPLSLSPRTARDADATVVVKFYE